METLCLAVVLFPLGAALIAGLLGRYIGVKGAHSVTIFAVSVSFIISLYLSYVLYTGDATSFNFNLYTWGRSAHTDFQVGFLIDRLTVLMMSVVTFVAWVVHIYTVGYMHQDPGYQRFFCYISLFTFGMLTLVMSNNFLQLFFGWEMVGLMSYLLIGFWFNKKTAIVANLKAFIVNRIGDFGFILGIAAVFYCFGTLDYAIVFAQVSNIVSMEQAFTFSANITLPAITFICLALFMGAMGKSAQIPLHVWLPDSMEGPTPISALIHAATMVTAGVFMVARLSPLFEYSDVALNFILVIGSLTCLLMGLVGIVENDIKRIIAYSTLSQLGYMMTAMGVSAYPIGMFHLTTHAFFKALLFLGAGSVILALHHEQDIWKMGGLRRKMPITYITMLIGSLALIGFPLFSGFYSKDLIIEAVKISHLPAAGFAHFVVLGSVFITALYAFRLFFVVFHTKARADKNIITHLHLHVHESPAIIWIPLVLLAIPSLIAGAFLVEPLFQDFFQGAIVMHKLHDGFAVLDRDFKARGGVISMTLHGLRSLPFCLGIAGIFTAWFCYIARPGMAEIIQKRLGFLYRILKAQYGFNLFNQWLLARGMCGLGSLFWRFGDMWLIDGVGVNGLARSIEKFSQTLRRIQTGYLYHYAFVMILGFLCLIAIVIGV
ncbi:MAG TPA: NADH-quinone oxidoreductase subunit L [Gammaproteobacteria bacterium]|nr:NADH-quinone oxidoreductase subunit L [Gammaproteobacteria bacterium]